MTFPRPLSPRAHATQNLPIAVGYPKRRRATAVAISTRSRLHNASSLVLKSRPRTVTITLGFRRNECRPSARLLSSVRDSGFRSTTQCVPRWPLSADCRKRPPASSRSFARQRAIVRNVHHLRPPARFRNDARSLLRPAGAPGSDGFDLVQQRSERGDGQTAAGVGGAVVDPQLVVVRHDARGKHDVGHKAFLLERLVGNDQRL